MTQIFFWWKYTSDRYRGLLRAKNVIFIFLGCLTIHCTRGNLKKKQPLFYAKMTILTQVFFWWKYTSDQYRGLVVAKTAIFILLGCLTIHYTCGIRIHDLKVIWRSRSKSVTFIISPQNLESPLYTKIKYFIYSMHSIRNNDLKVIWRSRWPWEYRHWISGPKCYKDMYIL